MEVAHRSGWNRVSTLPFGFRFWKPIAIEPDLVKGSLPARISSESDLLSIGFGWIVRIPRVPAATGDSTEEFFQVQEYVTVDFDGFVLFCVLFFFWRSGFQVLGSGASPLLRFTCIETSTMTRRGLTGHIRRGYRRNRRFQEKTVACMGGALFFFPVHNNTQTLP